MDDQPRLSFWASIGPTRRRIDRIAARRADELDWMSDEHLLGRFAVSQAEVLVDDRGRRYEAEIAAERKGRDLTLTVTVADLPRRRALVGHGFQRRDGETLARTVALYFND